MIFEWDEKKRKTNLKKHDIGFFELKKVFEKPILERVDECENYSETRWISLGDLDGKIVVLVYTREQSTIRLISARRVQKMKEKPTLKKSTNRKIDFSDIPETSSEFWADTEVRTPVEKTAISIRIDNDILEFFRKQGKGYQSKINDVLRYYKNHA